MMAKPSSPRCITLSGARPEMYGAALYRLRKEDFGEIREYDGISPAWPISYDDFEPYYTRAEQLYQVHGLRGRLTEPPSSAPYPFPPVSNEPRIQQLFDDLKAAGYHPFPAPCGVMMDEKNMAYSPANSAVRPAMVFPAWFTARAMLTSLPCARHSSIQNVVRCSGMHCVVKLKLNASGTSVTEVVVEMEGRQEIFHGDIVVVYAAPPTPPNCFSCRPTTSIPTAWPMAETRWVATICFITARLFWRSHASRILLSSRRRWH